MSIIPGPHCVIPLRNVDEVRKAQKRLLRRLSNTELAALLAAWCKIDKWIKIDDCFFYIMKTLEETIEGSLRESVKGVQELQGSRCRQLIDVFVSVGKFQKDCRDGLLDLSTTIKIPEIYLPQDIPIKEIPYNGSINTGKGYCMLLDPLCSTEYLTFYSYETVRISQWSQQMLARLTYNTLHTLLNCLFCYIEPCFRNIYSYKRGIVPSWWPHAIKFQGKNKYDRADTTALIIYIIFDLHSEGFRAIHAMDAIQSQFWLSCMAKNILYAILFVRQSQELCQGVLNSACSKAEVVLSREVVHGIQAPGKCISQTVQWNESVPSQQSSTETINDTPTLSAVEYFLPAGCPSVEYPDTALAPSTFVSYHTVPANSTCYSNWQVSDSELRDMSSQMTGNLYYDANPQHLPCHLQFTGESERFYHALPPPTMYSSMPPPMYQNHDISQHRVNEATMWTLCSVMLDDHDSLRYRIVDIEASVASIDQLAVVYLKLTSKTITELLENYIQQHSEYSIPSWLEAYTGFVLELAAWRYPVYFGVFETFVDAEGDTQVPINISEDIKESILVLLRSLAL